MQIDSGLAPSLGENALPALQANIQPQFTTQVHNITQLKASEAKIDSLLISVIFGLTAGFVIMVFGTVTDFMPRLIDNILLSIFVGLCVGVIAFALMNEEH